MNYKVTHPLFIFFVLIFAIWFQNAQADSVLVPQNYKIVAPQDVPKNFTVPAGKIVILDFFSYACPHCAHLNPALDQWRAQNASRIVSDSSAVKSKSSSNIIFHMIPVSFQPGWEIYSQAFYITKILHAEKQLHDALFEVAQNPLLGLNSPQQMRSFFLNHDISGAAYDQAVKDPRIAQEMAADKLLLKSFKIMGIPTVIVADEKHVYWIDNTTVPKGDPKVFVHTLTQLTTKK